MRAEVRTTRTQVVSFYHHNSLILIFYMKWWDKKKKEDCEFIDNTTFNNVKYCSCTISKAYTFISYSKACSRYENWIYNVSVRNQFSEK